MATDPVRLALIIAGILTILPTRPNAAQLLFLIGIAVLLAVSTLRSVRLATILALLAGAVVMRLVSMDRVGSDVLDVTSAAIDRVLAGGNPYGIGYAESRPPGSPFPYGPVALLWYLPVRSAPEVIELGASVVVAMVLALQGRVVGLAVYASASVLVSTAIDGSNDTSLGLLLLAAFMAAARWPAIGAALLATAVAFKLSALAFVPTFLAWGGMRVVGAFVATSLIFWAPVVARWSPSSFLRSTQLANDAHSVTAWSIGAIVRDITGVRVDALDELRFVLGGALAAATLAIRRSLDTVILAGSAVYVVTLHAGNWATFAYFAALAPLICWRLDDWLGLPTRPVARWQRRPAAEPQLEPAA